MSGWTQACQNTFVIIRLVYMIENAEMLNVQLGCWSGSTVVWTQLKRGHLASAVRRATTTLISPSSGGRRLKQAVEIIELCGIWCTNCFSYHVKAVDFSEYFRCKVANKCTSTASADRPIKHCCTQVVAFEFLRVNKLKLKFQSGHRSLKVLELKNFKQKI